MCTGDCINIFMAGQPCHTTDGYWGFRKYLTAAEPCQAINMDKNGSLGSTKIKLVDINENKMIKPGGRGGEYTLLGAINIRKSVHTGEIAKYVK